MKKILLTFTITAILVIQGYTFASAFGERTAKSASIEPALESVARFQQTADDPTPAAEIVSRSSAAQPVSVSETIPPPIMNPLISAYPFGNPAGCAADSDLAPDQMLANVQAALGESINLSERRQYFIWNGPQGTLLNVTDDAYAYEFVFNEYQHPLTYRGDQTATVFLNNGFAVWLRAYGGSFRLLAVPMVAGVQDSVWAEYVSAYWQKDGRPNDDRIYPVMKKLPCRWMIDQGYVSADTVRKMFPLDWRIPDYLTAGERYLAENCKEANRVSQEQIGFWDAASMCGPLTWQIVKDANGFPYRIGSWYADAGAFINANPKVNGQPWGTFDPETFDLMHTDSSMPGYDFAAKGNLYPGDMLYSYTSLYKTVNDQHFDHIFLVAGIGADQSRLSVTNMVQNHPYADCFIRVVVLYTPGDRENGVINHEWNGFGYGQTGTSGFDVFRWKWVDYHIDGQPIRYVVRWGDTLETIAFDWKVSPDSLIAANQFAPDVQLVPDQEILLPIPEPFATVD
jgi:hypothetical protein